jgi:hypothetical protein
MLGLSENCRRYVGYNGRTRAPPGRPFFHGVLITDHVRSIPWDSATFGLPAREVAEYSPAGLAVSRDVDRDGALADARCRGWARPWWWLAIQQMAQAGHTVVTSAISASNMPVLDLYSRLGFSFQHPQDIYHRVVTA